MDMFKNQNTRSLFFKCVSVLVCITIAFSVFTINIMNAVATQSSVWDGTKLSTFSGGTGKADDPYLIDSAEQFYDGEQPDGNIDCHGCADGCISAREGDGVAFAVAVVVMVAGVAAGREAQFSLQSHGLAFCNGEGSSVGIAAAVIQVSGGGDIGFCGAEQSHPQVITVGGRNTADETAVCSAATTGSPRDILLKVRLSRSLKSFAGLQVPSSDSSFMARTAPLMASGVS